MEWTSFNVYVITNKCIFLKNKDLSSITIIKIFNTEKSTHYIQDGKHDGSIRCTSLSFFEGESGQGKIKTELLCI